MKCKTCNQNLPLTKGNIVQHSTSKRLGLFLGYSNDGWTAHVRVLSGTGAGDERWWYRTDVTRVYGYFHIVSRD